MVQMKETPFRLQKKTPPPKAYPPGWGSYAVNIYDEDPLSGAAWMLIWINDILTDHGSNIRFVAIEEEPERHQVRFQITMDGKEI